MSEAFTIESASKYATTAAMLLYLVGFLVVAGYLSEYGVSSFSVLQLQYLVAGAWALGPPVALMSFQYVARNFEDRVVPNESTGKNWWRRALLSASLTGVPFGILLGLLLSIPGFEGSLTWGLGLRLFGFYVGMAVSVQLFWLSFRARRETRWVNRVHAAPFYLTLCLAITAGFIFWFSRRVYPLIPYSLGGGKPLEVVFVTNQSQLPPGILPESGSDVRSIPYKLLTVTDKSFILISPQKNEASIELSREGVLEMVVLRDRD